MRYTFLLDNHITIIATVLVIHFVYTVYKQYFRVNKETVDGDVILEKYLEMRYNKGNGYKKR